MEAITFKTLKKQEEIDSYLERFKTYVGVKLPYDYTQRCRIVGAFKADELVGGYMLVLRPDFRSLVFLPDEVKQTDPLFRNEVYEMMEINGLWIGAAVKTAWEQYRIWLQLAKDIFFSRKKYVLLMADSRNNNIRNVHAMTGARDIYEGAPVVMAGEKTHASIRVGYTTRWSIVRSLPRFWFWYRERELRFNRRLKHRLSARQAKAG